MSPGSVLGAKVNTQATAPLIVNTDGACHNNPGKGGWAAFWEGPGGPIELLGGELLTTNNRMELQAPLRALRAILEVGFAAPVIVRTDSQYVIKGVHEWRPSWEKNGFRAANKKPVKNAEIWRALFAVVDAFEGRVRFEWVRGHNGDPGNERADAMAQEGLRLADSARGEVAILRYKGRVRRLPVLGIVEPVPAGRLPKVG